MIWEFNACIDGYNDNMRRQDVMWGNNILYCGNVKKGTKLKDILGYNPYSESDDLTIDSVKDLEKRTNDRLGERLTDEEVTKLIYKSKKGKKAQRSK